MTARRSRFLSACVAFTVIRTLVAGEETDPRLHGGPAQEQPAGAAEKSCGHAGGHTLGRQERIVHGNSSEECVWRWQVSLRQLVNGTAMHFCGGTLIADQWVLTAAHCAGFLHDCKLATMQVVAGGWKADSHVKPTEATTMIRKVKQVWTHPQFNLDTAYDSDLALLKLDEPLPMTSCIGTACLPSGDLQAQEDAESLCEITGWGMLESEGNMASVLQEAVVSTVPQQLCEADYAKANRTVTGSMICAAGTTSRGVTDACQGDSGGPLVCLHNDRFVVTGVTSWGMGCGDSHFPGVYSRVAAGLDWIQDVMAGRVEHPDAMREEIDFKGHMWAVVSGSCAIDEEGCALSDGYPKAYNSVDKCRIAVNASAAKPIKVHDFSTEDPYDHLEVNCVPYSGKQGPQGIIPNSDIFWLADGSVQDVGWRLCPDDTPRLI